MRLIEVHGIAARLELSQDEIVLVSNAINEACNGLDIAEFQTRIGVSRERAQKILAEFGHALAAMRESPKG